MTNSTTTAQPTTDPHGAESNTVHTATLSPERRDLLETLAAHRGFLRQAAAGLSDDQARMRSTVSELTIGGLVKHVAAVERAWADFMVNGPETGGMNADIDWSDPDPALIAEHASGFLLLPGETLEGVLRTYEEAAGITDALVASIDLDLTHPLPTAPWFPEGACRSARRAAMHIIAETAQHAGHADIIREAIDGQKTMG